MKKSLLFSFLFIFGNGLLYGNSYYVLNVGIVSGTSSNASKYITSIPSNVDYSAVCTVSITSQPVSGIICANINPSFTVVATGSGTVTYQWQEDPGTGVFSDIADGGVYSGATSASLTLTGVTDGMNGNIYRCVVTDINCSLTSDEVDLTLNSITSDPADDTACPLNAASFSITYTGVLGGWQWQWQEDPGTGVFSDITDGGIYSGVNSDILSIGSVNSSMNGYKYRFVSIQCDPGTTTAAATLTVTDLPVVTEQPAAQSICASGNATYTVGATITSGTLNYQWQYRVKNTSGYVNLSDVGVYSGTTSKTLTITGADNTLAELYDNDNTDGKTNARFRCVVTGNGCDTFTFEAYLDIFDVPTVTGDPTDVTGCDFGNGVDTGFAVQSSIVTGAFPYQWQVDDGNGYVSIVDDAVYSGATSRVLVLTGAPSSFNGYKYRCEIGACAAPVYSLAGTLTIIEQPIIGAIRGAQSICAGSDASIIVEVTGNNLTYQWQVSTGNAYVDISDDLIYSGTNSSMLVISAPPSTMNNYYYQCIITSGTCTTSTGGSATRLLIYEQPTLSMATNNVTNVCEGGSTRFKVNPSFFPNASLFSYQWQVDLLGTGTFTDITDGTEYRDTNTKILTFNAVNISMNNLQYRCLIKGCITENSSEVETVTVNQLPLVVESPQSKTVCGGDPVTFTASATGTDVTYIWYKDDGTGAGYQQVSSSNTVADYSFNALANMNGYKFKVVATSANCTTTADSFEATLTVVDIITQPQTQNTICYGDNTTFFIEAQGVGFTYQWQQGGIDITDGGMFSGTTTNTLVITNTTSDMSGSYQCVISTSTCSRSSKPGQLLVYGVAKPVISTDFGNPQSPSLSVDNVSGDTYDWILDGTLYTAGGNGSSISINQEGSYTVMVNSNGCQSVESDAVVIVVTGFEDNLSISSMASIYPNPVTSTLILELASELNIEAGVDIVLSGIDGKVVYNKAFTSLQDRRLEIDMNSYKNGIYLVQVINEGKVSQYKIQKK